MSKLNNYDAVWLYEADRTQWNDTTPVEFPDYQQYFFGEECDSASAIIDTMWPGSRLLVGLSSVYDFSSIPCLATLTGSFESPLTITIDGDFPLWTADVSITERSTSISGTFPAWTSSVSILTGEVVSIAGSFPKWTGTTTLLAEQLNISGTFPKWSSAVSILTGEIISVAGEFPIWTSSISITPSVGAFVLAGTFPSWSGIIRVRQVVSVYGGIVMNASNYSITEYKDFPVKSIGYMNGHYYGVLSDGVYLLEGNKDSSTNIDAEIETGPIDFAVKVTTYPREAWIVYRSDGKVILRIREDEQTVYEKEIAFTNERLREERAKFGRGLRDQFYAFGFKNVDGSDFDLDSIAIDVDVVRGKVK